MKHERIFSVDSEGTAEPHHPDDNKLKITAGARPESLPGSGRFLLRRGKEYRRVITDDERIARENPNFYIEGDRVYNVEAQEWHQLEPGVRPLDLINELKATKKEQAK